MKRGLDRLGSQDAVTKCDPKMQDGSLGLSDMRLLIYDIRGVQVMLDRDLAVAYKVSTTAFNQAVKRNVNRFPETFRFQLTKEEHEVLISQIVTSKRESGEETRGGYHKLPFAFTEQGIAMLSGILRSDVAVGICHDRFIIVDQKEIFVIGASLKDAARQTFSAARIGSELIPGLLDSLRKSAVTCVEYGVAKPSKRR